jgi:hypothetical protein
MVSALVILSYQISQEPVNLHSTKLAQGKMDMFLDCVRMLRSIGNCPWGRFWYPLSGLCPVSAGNVLFFYLCSRLTALA